MNKKLQELIAAAEAKMKQLNDLLGKGEATTAEDITEAKAVKADLEGLKGQITAFQEAEGLQRDVDGFKQWMNRPATGVPMGAGEPVGYQPAGETVITTQKDGTTLVEQMGAGVYTERQLKAVRDREYKAAFLSYLRRGEKGVTSGEYKVLQEGIDDQGGYLVPEDILTRILMKAPTPTRVAGMVTTINTSRDSVVLPRVVYATDDLYTTGVRVTWTGEIPAAATTHRVTEPVFGQFRVPIYTAMLSMPLTNNMVEDTAFDIEGWCADRFRETDDLLKDNMILNGTGIDQPSGILQNPNGANEPATVATGDANLLTADGLIDLAGALPEQYDEASRFVFNKTNTHLAIRKLKDGDGRYLFGAGVQDSGLSASLRPNDLLGYPFTWSGFMPNVAANAEPIIFGDLRGYILANRIGMSIQVLRELYAETNQILLLGRVRFGGDVAEPWRMKIQTVSA